MESGTVWSEMTGTVWSEMGGTVWSVIANSSRELNINELKKLCSDNKSSFRTGTDYHLVVFKNKKNASFPDSPITAEYGFEQEKIEHIKARYTYYRGNGYSVLDIYEKNMWESVAEEIKI